MEFSLLQDGIVYSFQHTDAVRAESTSGGAFTALSDLILQEGGWVAGAGYDEDLRVVHKLVNTTQERNALRGSKYVQSMLGNVLEQIRQILEEGLPVLFVGTPCQVQAVQRYLSYRKTDMSRFYCCDFICTGVTSPKIQQEYMGLLRGKRQLIDYRYRSKKKGWGIHCEQPVYAGRNQRFDPFLVFSNIQLFYSHYTLRPSCYRCPFANLHRCSDLTIGDCWGIDSCDPESNDKKGLSLILVNTEKGRALMQCVSQQTEGITIKEYKAEQLMQPRLKSPHQYPPQRAQFWDFYQKHGLKAAMAKYAQYNPKGFLKYFIKYAPKHS